MADVAIDGNTITVPMASGNVMKLPLDSILDNKAYEYADDKINVTEELNRNGIWKSLDYENQKHKKDDM